MDRMRKSSFTAWVTYLNRGNAGKFLYKIFSNFQHLQDGINVCGYEETWCNNFCSPFENSADLNDTFNCARMRGYRLHPKVKKTFTNFYFMQKTSSHCTWANKKVELCSTSIAHRNIKVSTASRWTVLLVHACTLNCGRAFMTPLLNQSSSSRTVEYIPLGAQKLAAETWVGGIKKNTTPCSTASRFRGDF